MRTYPALLFALLVFLTAAPAIAWAPTESPTLWTLEQLQATPQERRAGPLTAPDRSPPGRLEPVHYPPPVAAPLRGSIRRVDTAGEKIVALTFDLCELADQKTGYDGEVVDALRQSGAEATFFAGGKWMRSHPERAMQLMADPLFEVGSHAWTHGNFGVLPLDAMRDQVRWTQAQYELLREELTRRATTAGASKTAAAVPQSIVVFRFPYGRCRPEALALLAGEGLAAIQWDVNTMDAGHTQTAQAIIALVERGVKPGSIVLMHANGFGVHTAEAVRLVVPMLRAKGYRLVTVSRLLAAGKPVVAQECYDGRSGDTAVYDKQFGDGTVHAKNR